MDSQRLDESPVTPAPGDLYREAVARAATIRGVAMLIGGTDTGKTTFAEAVVKAALERDRRVAVIDADSGQSEIGPPATLGLGFPDPSFTRLAALKPRGLAFTGSVSPPGFLLDWVIGTRHLADRARKGGADLVLLDMPGLVTGDVGLRLNTGVAEAVRPETCILFERDRELREIRRGLPPCRLLRPGIPPAVRRKSPGVRALRRVRKYADYFQDAGEWELPVDRGAIRGGSLFLGRSLRPPALAALQSNVSVRLYHVEKGLTGVLLVSHLPPKQEDRAALERRFPGEPIRWLEATRLKGLLIGLLDRKGETVAIGRIGRVDFRRRRLKIATPWLDPDGISGLIWGVARIQPDGEELSPLRPGEL